MSASSSRPFRVAFRVGAACVPLALTLALPGLAPAAPAPSEPPAATRATTEPARITDVEHVTDRRWEIEAWSPSMDRTVPLTVLRSPAPGSHPVLYLLNGAGGGEDGANWLSQTDAEQFFADHAVDVVIPDAGIGSYYTDWATTDPNVGTARWETFLTAELPPALDELLDTNGTNGIAGLSMSATSVLDLAARHPDLYSAVASYSGCARTSTPLGEAAVRTVVAVASGADATNMWGPPGDPRWAAHDPYVHAENLRGTALYVSSGNGRRGPHDAVDAARPEGSPSLEEQLVVGGALEAAARTCTEDLAQRLDELGIPAEIHLPPYGTHSWPYWQDELHRSWPTVASGLGIEDDR